MSTPEYLQAIGQFIWDFAALEWDVISTLVYLHNDDWQAANTIQPAGTIAKNFRKRIRTLENDLPTELAGRLRLMAAHYEEATVERNALLHGHPYGEAGGITQLGGEIKNGVYRRWSLQLLHDTRSKIVEFRRISGPTVQEARAWRATHFNRRPEDA